MADISRYRLFLSSTSELQTERAALREALLQGTTFEPYLYDFDNEPKDRSPRDWILKKLQESDLLVLLLGNRFGSPYDEEDLTEGSIVQWEYEVARDRLRRESLQAFRKVEAADEAEVEPDIDPEQQTFVKGLEDFHGGTWMIKFGAEEGQEAEEAATVKVVKTATEDLNQKLNAYLTGWLAGLVKREKRRTLLTLAVAGVLATVLVLVYGNFYLPSVGKEVVTMVAASFSGMALFEWYRRKQ